MVTIDNGALLGGPATNTITVQASDGAGGTSTADFGIDVINVKPEITELNSSNGDVDNKSDDGVVAIDGSFTDPA